MGIEVVTKTELELGLQQVMEELAEVKRGQLDIIGRLDKLKGAQSGVTVEYIPAAEFMKAIGIKRWKFDQLIAGNMIKTVKKKRKIYVAASEVKRYFVDPNIQ
jgi:hypothetical protein